MNNLSRKHHFIPVFYGRRWADESTGKLFAWWRPRTNMIVRKHCHPHAVGWQMDLNSFPLLPKGLATWFEDVFLRHTDDFAARALSKIEAGNLSELSKEEICGWARFLISMRCRQPGPLAELKMIVKDTYEYYAINSEDIYNEMKKPHDPPHKDFIASMSKEEIEKSCVMLLKSAIDNKIAGDRITHRNWGLIHLQGADKPLVTSDFPVLFSMGASRPHILLPIGPKKLFVAAEESDIIHALRNAPANLIVSDLNNHSIKTARDFIYGCDITYNDEINRSMSVDCKKAPFFPYTRKVTGNVIFET